MKLQARLIYKSGYTCFHSPLPVYFYGLSNGKVVVLFASSKTDFAYDTSIKWILADHIDFRYDFETNKIFTTDNDETGIDEFMLFADNLEQRINIVATFGNFSSKTEAQQYFNINAFNMLTNQTQDKYEMEYF